MLAKFDAAVETVVADPSRTIVIKTYGREWDTSNDWASVRKCLEKYSFPDKVEIETPLLSEIPSVEDKLRQAYADVAESEGTKRVKISAYGREWDNVKDLDYALQCVAKYKNPKKIRIKVVKVATPWETLLNERKGDSKPRCNKNCSDRLIQAEIDAVKARKRFSALLKQETGNACKRV